MWKLIRNKVFCEICNKEVSEGGSLTQHLLKHVREGKLIDSYWNNKHHFYLIGSNIEVNIDRYY